MKKHYWGASSMGGTLAALTLTVACGDTFGGENDCKVTRTCVDAGGVSGAEGGKCPPPTVVSVSPKDASVDIELDAKVAIKFSAPLDAKTVTPATVRVLDGDTVVPGSLEYANNTVTFTPTSPLALLAPYRVVVTTGVEDAEGAPLRSEYTSEFSTRDGAWKTVDVARGSFWTLSNGLPISSAGDVLVAWAGTGNENCPVTARWFRKGVVGTTKVISFDGLQDCASLSSSGNAAGVATLVWNLPNSEHGTYVHQYRAGAWQASPTLVSKDTSGHYFSAPVAPNGVVTLFEPVNTGTTTRTTDAAGRWLATGNVVTANGASSPASIAFDADGNALALWHRIPIIAGGLGLERIVVTRFDAATSKWSAASDLPGSVAANPPTTSNRRGVPVVAVDDEGDAMALWVDASATGKLMASRYSQATGWDAPESISGASMIKSVYEPPALVFDGEAFVAAWTADEAGKYYTFTARHDAARGWGAAVRQQVTAADGTSALRMPRLVSDRRGNLLLVFAKGSAPTYTLVYQRYAHGAWDALKAVPGGTVAGQYFENGGAVLALSMNDSGLAALSWGNYNEDDRISVIRLASFY